MLNLPKGCHAVTLMLILIQMNYVSKNILHTVSECVDILYDTKCFTGKLGYKLTCVVNKDTVYVKLFGRVVLTLQRNVTRYFLLGHRLLVLTNLINEFPFPPLVCTHWHVHSYKYFGTPHNHSPVGHVAPPPPSTPLPPLSSFPLYVSLIGWIKNPFHCMLMLCGETCACVRECLYTVIGLSLIHI